MQRILKLKDHNFQRYIDVVTSQNLNYTNSQYQYQDIFTDDRMVLIIFIKFCS